MTRNEYIGILKGKLDGRGDDALEFIRDVERHFDEASAAGVPEDLICQRLGDPIELANEFLGGGASAAGEGIRATLGTQHRQLEGVTNLTVELARAKLDIEASPDDTTYIDINDESDTPEACIEVLFENGHLLIRQRSSRAKLFLLGLINNNKYSSARIRLGKGFTGSLKASGGSGRIDIRGVSGREIKLTTASGGIFAAGLTAQRMVLTAASGSVTANMLSGDEISLSTASGGIHVSDVRAPILKCNAAAGGVTVERSRCATVNLITASGGVKFASDEICQVTANTASGSIVLALPPQQQMTISAHTLSGGVEIGYAAMINTANGKKEYIVGDGSARVRCNTASGSIKVLPNEA